MKELTITNLKGRDLPEEWVKKIDILPDEAVSVTIRAEEPQQPKREIDWKAVEEILQRFDSAPVKDSRTPDEIIGYNEYGVPE